MREFAHQNADQARDDTASGTVLPVVASTPPTDS